ncbi:alpha/beta hydrolase [Oceanibacterium hippocampi]|uniref:Alpha/beta hydrolase family protein n=1 Tax=Oceanibacterium hippocampi TaxID=745714 RepID=A0A1Y5R649_9PROT|nr:hypothetical protein [Oceanibacterium hippocampi]SLN10109.1 Alpha/beta hydrolase family protein [Oceanibacterium hippocampi]
MRLGANGSRLTGLVAHPWFDLLAEPTVTSYFLPLSRAWAAARVADGDVGRFAGENGLRRPGKALARAIVATAGRDRRYREAEQDWQQAMFGDGDEGQARRLGTERAERAFRLMAARAFFLPWRSNFAAVRWDIETPVATHRRHGARLARTASAYPAPAMTDIERSATVANGKVRRYWLRFTAAGSGDRMIARVSEPASGNVRATVILLHGLAVEDEMWPNPADPVLPMVAEGVRFVQPEAPWHGRRTLPGTYGGEPVLARGPGGLLDFFQSALSEIALLVRWAKNRGDGPVGLGGVSLGALTIQLVATASRNWAGQERPDALLLIATTGRMTDVLHAAPAFRRLKLFEAVQQGGWSMDEIETWRPLLEPSGEPCLPPERIVMVLGNLDTVTPYDGGLALARDWRVPEDNLFLRRQGHFSLALGVLSRPAPIVRFLEILGVGASNSACPA